MRQFTALVTMLFRHFIRDKQTVFFSAGFPLVFLLIFGFMFGDGGDGVSRPTIAIYSEQGTDTETLKAVLRANEDLFFFAEMDTEDGVIAAVSGDQVHFGLTHKDGEFHIHYNPRRLQGNQYYQQLVRTIASDYDRLRLDTAAIVTVQQREVAVRAGITPVEYMLPGVLALTVLSTGLFAITASFMRFREQGVLRRFAATPMQRPLFMIAFVVTRTAAVYLSCLLIMGLSRLLFDISFVLDWGLFLLFTFVSTVMMMGLGFIISILARSANTASEIGGILLTIMIFFSGIYFPVEFLPRSFRVLGQVLPLHHIAQGLRFIMDIEAMTLGQFWLKLGGMGLAAAAMLIVAARRITWEEAR